MPAPMELVLWLLTALMAAVVVQDVWKYRIPNWLNLSLILLYGVALYLTPAPVAWGWALATAGGLFALGTLAFIGKCMGGGDVKMFTACGLWVGHEAVLPFLLYTSLYGGALTMLLLMIRMVARGLNKNRETPWNLPTLLTMRGPVPYGVAIVCGFFSILIDGRIPVFSGIVSFAH